MPKFSVIITVFNKEKHIYNTLKSVCEQTITDIEIIIINDGSTDNSLKEISKITHSNLHVYTLKNSGVSNARNFGCKKATGDYFSFLDGDDIWEPHYLEEIKKLILKFPKEQIFSTASSLFYNNKISKYTYSIPNKNYQVVNYFKASLQTSILNSSTLVMHKSAFNTIGYFNTKYSRNEDIEYWFRIGLKYPIAFSRRQSVLIKKTKNSLSSQKFNIKDVYMFKEYNLVNKNFYEFRKVLDLNLFALALLCKENNYSLEFKTLKRRINPANFSFIRILLLYLPGKVIKILKKIYNR